MNYALCSTKPTNFCHRELKKAALAKSKAKAEARRRRIAAAKAKHAALIEQEENQRYAKALKKQESAKRRFSNVNIDPVNKLL